jgi:hypothetical protein
VNGVVSVMDGRGVVIEEVMIVAATYIIRGFVNPFWTKRIQFLSV